MRHFEIEVMHSGYPFRYCCTTVAEAFEAIKAVIDEKRSNPISYETLDTIIAQLVDLKGNGGTIRPSSDITVTDVEGEI